MYLYDWMEQAERDSKESGNIPAVFHKKKNNAEILVTMRFDDFMKIYKEFDAAQFLNKHPLSPLLESRRIIKV